MSPHDEENERQWEELIFTLQNRSKSTLVSVTFESPGQGRALRARLARELPDYRCHELDLSAVQVTSLYGVLRERVPEEILHSAPGQSIVHVLGLENSLHTREGRPRESTLLAQLNMERELLFRDFPFVLIIWSDAYIWKKIGREAQDLRSWITYAYRFRAEGDAIDAGAFQPPESLPPGHDERRRARIAELEARYDRLLLDESDYERVVRDKIGIQRLLGQEYLDIHDPDNALLCLQRALNLLAQFPENKEELAELHFYLGHAHRDKRNFPQAKEEYGTTLSIYEELNDRQNQASLLHQLGRVAQEEQRFAEAEDYLRQALAIMIECNDRHAQGSTLNLLGVVAHKQQRFAEAEDYLRQALAIDIEFNDRHAQGMTLLNLGLVAKDQQRFAEAEDYFRQALAIDIEFNDRHSQGMALGNLGLVAWAQQRFAEAEDYLRQALEIFRDFKDEFRRDMALRNLARLWREWGDERVVAFAAEVLGWSADQTRAAFIKTVGGK